MNRLPSYGFLVGRYQVDDLHDGHKEIIRQVKTLHDRVFVFLGTPAFPCKQNNPMDFLTRKLMIESTFPDLTCLALPNRRTDTIWSKELDKRIEEVAKYGEVTLYGGRDSFVSKYNGKHKKCELHVSFPHSGTQIRGEISNRVRSTADFRAGVIYAVSNQYPNALSTVDIAIVNGTTDDSFDSVCLIHKNGDVTEDGIKLWRFPGGFVTPNKDKSKKFAAKREALEETGQEVQRVEYIDSFPVKDWRLEGEGDQVFTDFFFGYNGHGVLRAEDDADEAKWFPLHLGDLSGIIVPEHGILYEAFMKVVNQKKKEQPHVA